MNTVAILGMGLMGGSLGLALKGGARAPRISGYARREEVRRQALEMGAADEMYDDPRDAVTGADLVVLAVPIYTMRPLVCECLEGFETGAVVTDVGSTKEELEETLVPLLTERDVSFVGSHPIAGSEQQGLDAARADLYQDATVIVCPPDGADPEAVETVRELWTGRGGVVAEMKANDHDTIMARTSHLPHVIATLLSNTVGRDGKWADIGPFCGPGFRDTTRVAEGAPSVWLDIVESNSRAIEVELRAFALELERFLNRVSDKDQEAIRKALARGRDSRIQLLEARAPNRGSEA